MALVILDPTAAPPGRLPDGWQLKVNHGTPNVTVIGEPSSRVLRFRSEKSSFALERGVEVDIDRFPYLTWSWKVSELPAGGDLRRSGTDDQAAQVLVLFADRRILSYLWDSSAPRGMWQTTAGFPKPTIWRRITKKHLTALPRASKASDCKSIPSTQAPRPRAILATSPSAARRFSAVE